jgi:hypothetical protein
MTYMLLVDGIGHLVEEGLDLGIQFGLKVSGDRDAHILYKAEVVVHFY